jgi:hypothetical protein
MKGSMSAAQNLEKEKITIQMAQFLSTKQTIYLASLQQIYDTIRTPPLLAFIQELATNRNFCSAFSCFKQTSFLLKDTTLEITTQKQLTLAARTGSFKLLPPS